ncbi:nucleotide-binding protein [Serratia quinivorans]|uniref:nucleotide-binding protein n=1 Tax=Serratia quinivorans TaxID=137545 RepID=UPI00217B51D2|nr:nucleotide-binding protein [Serratia quinivorans]CAI0868310.1 Predicted nucleotide-binding protein containing TIR-like domain [Serratia quinivorans]CAI0894041.1 Predicted nucleotide-binding protein containing TIR-like domain [Serratia quinivorans]CAI1505022.1 Predicted nucleotide-binding protein containing TIR-like domain [Serratia quinivorans]CAI2050978.1 Predicted nucleotide-binding protein containing TIR-like domain [Serratia quinivorans]CAI2085195.1 Predicted nucleotide-binding protein 
MEPKQLIEDLRKLNKRLEDEVASAYDEVGYEFGKQRYTAFRRSLSHFIKENIPSEISNCNDALTQHIFRPPSRHAPKSQSFWENNGERVASYIDSLIIDITNGEFDLRVSTVEDKRLENPEPLVSKKYNKVFIVHGHNNEVKIRTARFVEKLGFEAIILHEQANRGKTIIEKIEHYTDVDFAIVLYTPDDLGNKNELAKNGDLKPRARQNVIFEHGYLMAKIGRGNVTALVSDSLELPNDISGVVYISDENWEMEIAKEMKVVGYNVDFNKLF